MLLPRLLLYPSEAYLNMHIIQRENGWRLERHIHSYHQLIWVTDGVLHVDCQHQSFTLGKGKLCLIPPGHEHALHTEVGYTQFGLSMNDQDPTGMKELLYAHMTEVALLDHSHKLDTLIPLQHEAGQGTRLSRLKLVNQLDAMMLSIVEDVVRKSDIDFRERLLHELRQHLSRKMTLKHLSQTFHISPSHLERLTYKEFGCGVIELHNQQRMERACSLLLTSDLSIELISSQLGFYDSAHFSRFFKRKMNQTPSQYRKSSQTL